MAKQKEIKLKKPQYFEYPSLNGIYEIGIISLSKYTACYGKDNNDDIITFSTNINKLSNNLKNNNNCCNWYFGKVNKSHSYFKNSDDNSHSTQLDTNNSLNSDSNHKVCNGHSNFEILNDNNNKNNNDNNDSNNINTNNNKNNNDSHGNNTNNSKNNNNNNNKVNNNDNHKVYCNFNNKGCDNIEKDYNYNNNTKEKYTSNFYTHKINNEAKMQTTSCTNNNNANSIHNQENNARFEDNENLTDNENESLHICEYILDFLNNSEAKNKYDITVDKEFYDFIDKYFEPNIKKNYLQCKQCLKMDAKWKAKIKDNNLSEIKDTFLELLKLLKYFFNMDEYSPRYCAIYKYYGTNDYFYSNPSISNYEYYWNKLIKISHYYKETEQYLKNFNSLIEKSKKALQEGENYFEIDATFKNSFF